MAQSSGAGHSPIEQTDPSVPGASLKLASRANPSWDRAKPLCVSPPLPATLFMPRGGVRKKIQWHRWADESVFKALGVGGNSTTSSGKQAGRCRDDSGAPALAAPPACKTRSVSSFHGDGFFSFTSASDQEDRIRKGAICLSVMKMFPVCSFASDEELSPFDPWCALASFGLLSFPRYFATPLDRVGLEPLNRACMEPLNRACIEPLN